MKNALTPEILLRAYAAGVFPMAEGRDDPTIHWIDPRKRGVFPLDNYHISRSLSRHIRHAACSIRTDTEFSAVVKGCADRAETWINPEIFRLYSDLHDLGFAHSLEVWDGEALIGGVYGVAIGAAFFGESMFSRRTNASKTALAYLIHLLNAGGFSLFDTQFLTPHLASLGAVEISRAQYHQLLKNALPAQASFTPAGYCPVPESVAAGSVFASAEGSSTTSGNLRSGTSQRNTQTS